jgi:hypothetical protein
MADWDGDGGVYRTLGELESSFIGFEYKANFSTMAQILSMK